MVDSAMNTFISISGLMLCTGRVADAAQILRSFSRYVRNGLIPNNFPDRPGVDPALRTCRGGRH